MKPEKDSEISLHFTPEKMQSYRQLSVSNPTKTVDLLSKILEEPLDAHDRIQLSLILAHTLWTLGELDRSQIYYKKVYTEADKLNLEEAFADALVGLGMIENVSGNFSGAADKFPQAIRIYQKLNSPQKEANVMNRYGINRVYLGLPKEAVEILERAVELAIEGGDKNIEISARNNMALIQMNTGDIKKASEQFKICADIALEIHNNRSFANINSNYAETLQYLGEYEEAQKEYMRALKVAEELKSNPSIAIIKTEIGGFYTEIGDMSRAQKFLEEALELFKNVDFKFTYIQCLNNYALFWLNNGNYLRSVEVLQQAIHIVEDTNLVERKIQLLVCLAQAHYALRNLDTSYNLLKEATQLAWKQSHSVGKGLTLIERARLSLSYSNYYEAELLLMEVQIIADKTHHFDMRINSILLLAQTYLVKTQQHRFAEDAQKISRLIEEVMQITIEKQLWPRYIDTLTLRAILHAMEGNTQESLQGLTIAQEEASLRRMNARMQEIMRIRGLVGHLAENETDRKYIMPQIYNILTQEIQRMTTQGINFQFSENDVNAIFTVSYKVDEKIGTVLHSCENVKQNDPQLARPLNMAGNIFMVSLGQGHEYHQGLFGPLPFGDGNFRALVYSCMMDDPSKIDSRIKGKVFFITCFVYPQRLSPLFNNQEKMEQIFANHFQHASTVELVTPSFLTQIRNAIVDFFLKPYLF